MTSLAIPFPLQSIVQACSNTTVHDLLQLLYFYYIFSADIFKHNGT